MSFAPQAAEGPAPVARVLQALWIDWLSGAVLAMLAFPFPIVRASAAPAVFGVSIAVSLFAGAWLYLGLTAALLGRSPGMYLRDLAFEAGRPALGRALAWAAVLVLAAIPALAVRTLADGHSGPAARLTGVRVGGIGSGADTLG